MDEDHDQTTEKRFLKKVRRPFLTRRADDQEPPSFPSPPEHKKEDKGSYYNFPIEENKTYFETPFLKPEMNIEKIKIEGEGQCVAVTLFLRSNGENTLRPKLAVQNEAYGDLEFKRWALNFQEYHTIHPDIIDRYFDFLHSANPDIYSNLRKAKRKAVEAYKNIESTYPFRKFMVYSDKETTKMLSCSYSEKLFAELGYMLEPFIEWIKENGFPTLFETDSSVHMDMTAEFLNNMAMEGEALLEGPEYMTYCFDKNGQKIRYIAQFLTVVEPSPDGLFGTFYVVLKKRHENSSQAKDCEDAGFEEEGSFKAVVCSEELVHNTFQTLKQNNAGKMSTEDF